MVIGVDDADCTSWHHSLGSQHCEAVVGTGLAALLCASLAEHFGHCVEEEEVAAAVWVSDMCLVCAYPHAVKTWLRHTCELHSSAVAGQNVHTDLHPVVNDNYLHALVPNSPVCDVLILQILLP
jgi:hypothetical protein